MTRQLILLFCVLVALSCVPPRTPETPKPDAHCAESCRQLQELGCRRGSDQVCATYDERGECTSKKSCVEACADAPHVYPEVPIAECPQ